MYKGWYQLTAGTLEGWRKAIELFEEVHEGRTDALIGHALLAYTKWMGASFGFDDPDALLAEARIHAEKGIELGDVTGLSNMVMAAIEHNPNSLEALLVLSASQTELGLDRRARATAQLVRDRFPTTSAEEWLVRNPYQDEELIDRWRKDLATAGLI